MQKSIAKSAENRYNRVGKSLIDSAAHLTDAFPAICCLQKSRFTFSKPSIFAIASDGKFIHHLTTSFNQSFPRRREKPFSRKGVERMDLFDLIGPVMIGPSSSHTAGAARIGLTAYSLLGERVVKADVGLHGSFAKTYRGHGTDRAIVGGLLGMHVDDPRLRDSLEIARQQGMDVRFEQVNLRGAHPNTVRLHVTGERGATLTLEAASVGGGNIEIHRINGLNVNFTGKADTMIIHHIDMPGAIAAVTSTLARHRVNIANMQVYRRKLGGDAMMVLELDGAPSQADLDIIRQIPDIRSCTFLKRRDD